MPKAMKDLTRKIRNDDETKSESQRIMRDVVALVDSATSLTSNNKVHSTISGIGLILSASAVGKGIYKLYKKTIEDPEYVVKISEIDDIFGIAEEWLMEVMPEEKQLSVYAHSQVSRGSGRRSRRSSPSATWESELMSSPDSEEDRVNLLVSFDGTITQKVEVQGHTVEIYSSIPENYGKMGRDHKPTAASLRSINFVCKTLDARNSVLDELESRSQFIVQNQPSFFSSRNWGGFRRTSNILPRSINSVMLKEGQMDRILGYIHTFLENEEAYLKVGIPYRMGLLLHGNPGSGKSSTAMAIANELGFNVYYISLSSLDDDDALAVSLADVPPRSIVVLEDIDVAHSVKDRENDKGVTMTGMLNVLDGFISPHGVITIMTTNRLDVLDDAIIRPGRVDIQEELGEIDNYQLHKMCEYFLGYVPEELPEIVEEGVENRISSAEIVGVFKNHIPNFEEAESDLVKFVKGKSNKLYNIA